jgi:hypothetical protein
VKTLVEYIKEVIVESSFGDGYFNVGDEILFGKWKNKRGKIVDVKMDERGVPIVVIEPIPKGRKKLVTMGLYKIWKAPEIPR